MKEIIEGKNKKVKHLVYVGDDMFDLIRFVSDRFFEEYGFQPTQKDVTNLIAKRVKENKLF
jgi:sulfur relay (sulfurtransferase) DsrC/TusE family protein